MKSPRPDSESASDAETPAVPGEALEPLTDEQRRELDRRIEELERDPDGELPWDEVLRRLRERLA